MSDFSYALRQLLRHRGFALAAVFTLGLGISLVATQFSLIDGLFLRGMPFPNADRLVHVSRTAEAGSGSWWTQDIDIFRAQVEQQQSFEALGAISFGNYNMVAQGDLPKRLQGAAVTDGYFQALGTAPALGRAAGLRRSHGLGPAGRAQPRSVVAPAARARAPGARPW